MTLATSIDLTLDSLIGGENSDIVYPDRMCQGMEMSRDCAEVTFICRTPGMYARSY